MYDKIEKIIKENIEVKEKILTNKISEIKKIAEEFIKTIRGCSMISENSFR